ncbi:MAG: PEP-CTERM sorting domain-containing protein [Denitromonas halophila]|nr:MAG: PEP-CTERM sorting domain-containing protein [Denitromonas halophila]TVT73211.1 MAG: PEP-CTERM sorting domain-containing protein [Denitromonas halophila]
MLPKSALLTIALTTCISSANASTLYSGDSAEYSFNSLAFADTASYMAQGGATIQFSGDLLDNGDAVRLEAFEDAADSSPFYTNTFTNPTDHFGFTYGNRWQDLNGALKLTVLSGSVNVHSISYQVIAGGNRYISEVQISPVPEPSIALMLGAGLLTIIYKTKKHRKTRSPDAAQRNPGFIG